MKTFCYAILYICTHRGDVSKGKTSFPPFHLDSFSLPPQKLASFRSQNKTDSKGKEKKKNFSSSHSSFFTSTHLSNLNGNGKLRYLIKTCLPLLLQSHVSNDLSYGMNLGPWKFCFWFIFNPTFNSIVVPLTLQR